MRVMKIIDLASGETTWSGDHRSGTASANQGATDGEDADSGDESLGAAGKTAEAVPVWSIVVRPDGKGFMSGGGRSVCFWDFELSAAGLQATPARQLHVSHDILSLCYSPTKNAAKLFVAVGLLDSTVKVYFDDSLKFFLSLYGHKLPVLAIDISSDNTLLVSGSADKTIKIWGLDFGDCHRSLRGHGDSITSIKFEPHTHYFFSASKDGTVRYWDADR